MSLTGPQTAKSGTNTLFYCVFNRRTGIRNLRQHFLVQNKNQTDFSSGCTSAGEIPAVRTMQVARRVWKGDILCFDCLPYTKNTHWLFNWELMIRNKNKKLSAGVFVIILSVSSHFAESILRRAAAMYSPCIYKNKPSNRSSK